MEFAVGLAPVATVAQLVGNVGGLIIKIKRAVETARRNETECRHLADRVSVIEGLLPHLQKDPAVVKLPLVRLGNTLKEAHELIVSCSKKRWKKLSTAERQAESFREIHGRINSHLQLFPFISHITLNERLDQIQIQLDDLRTTAPSPAASGSWLPEESARGSRDPHVAAERFTWAEIAVATKNFSHVLGEGSSDSETLYYKGCLHHGLDVAVKVLGNGRQGGEDTFWREIQILSPLSHGNIVPLLGWCSEEAPAQRMLVYEYMANRTLRDHLRGGSSTPSPVTTSWRARVEALLGASRAIDHLHCHAAQRVIHRNVTSSNILLDASWTPRLSGFGASVLLAQTGTGGDDEHQGQPVPEVMGTFGDPDPVYEHTKIVDVRPASDVYSFGVVMLETLTGNQPVDISARSTPPPPTPIVDTGRLRDVLDGRPAPEPTPEQLKALELVAYTAVRCLWPVENRPAICDVVANLEKALKLIRCS